MLPSLRDALHDAKNLHQSLLFWREQIQAARGETDRLRAEMKGRRQLVLAAEWRRLVILAELDAALRAGRRRDG